jgi:hypothetical protein
MGVFNLDQSIEEMLDLMNRSGGNTETIHAGPVFIGYKLQKKLLEDEKSRHKELLDLQNTYNRQQLRWSRWTAWATIVLAIATIALAIATLLLAKFD